MLNRKSIEVQAGNFSGWWKNKARKDAFSRAENEKHLKEISSLKRASERSARWAEKNENTKIGFDPVREHDRFLDTRAYIGAKTKKMQSRRKNYEIRIEHEIRATEGLFQDIENSVELKLTPEKYYKDTLIYTQDYSFQFPDQELPLISHFSFSLKQGERIFLHGTIKEYCRENGFDESLFLAILRQLDMDRVQFEKTMEN